MSSTRSEILSAAYRLFAENGFHGTSMRQIAAEAGIAVGGIYNHFAGKEEIFTTIFFEYHPVREMVSRIQNAQGDSLETILADAARRLENGLMDHPEQFLALMFIEMVEFKRRHLPQFIHEFLPQILAVNQRIFANRENLGDHPEFLRLRALLGLFTSHFLIDWIVGENLPHEAPESALQTLVDIYLHGILKTPDTGATPAPCSTPA